MEVITRYVPVQDFNITSQMVTAQGSAGQTALRTVLASREVPNGSRLRIEIFSAKVIDLANQDQIFFAIERNGVAIAPGYERIPGLQFEYQAQQAINIDVAPGNIQLVAYNISGANLAIEPDALGAATPVRCQSWMTGTLLGLRRMVA